MGLTVMHQWKFSVVNVCGRFQPVKVVFYALIAVVLLACDDNAANTTKDKGVASYMALRAGSWWVYDGAEVDMNGSPIAGTEFKDSIYALGKTQYRGSSADALLWCRTHGSQTHKHTVYLRSTATGVDLHSVLLEPVFTRAFCCDEFADWKSLLREAGQTWTVVDTMNAHFHSVISQDNSEIIRLRILYFAHIEGKAGGGQLIDIPQQGSEALRVDFTGSYREQLDTTFNPDYTFPDGSIVGNDLSIDLSVWFVQNVGMVKILDRALGVQRELIQFHVQ